MGNNLYKPEAQYVKAEIIDSFPPGYKEWADRKEKGLDLNFFHQGRRDYDPLPDPPTPMYEMFMTSARLPGFFFNISNYFKTSEELEEALAVQSNDEARIYRVGYHEEIAGRGGGIH